jgi:hypothetical protein
VLESLKLHARLAGFEILLTSLKSNHSPSDELDGLVKAT